MEYRVRRQPSGDLESDLFDVDPHLDARNRFARKAQLYIDDVDGNKQDDYRFYQRVDLEIREDFNDTFDREFSGMVVETHPKEQNGADILEVELYSYDYLLRTDQIDLDVSGQSIETGLKNIVAESPVTWNSDKVVVGDEQELNREFVGEKIDSAIGELASLSENEIFGVDNDLEFFFNPPESQKSPESITNSDWLDYDFPELDKESINEVTVYYGPEGEGGKVTVDDAPDKLNRQDKLDSDGAPTNYIERTFESITDSQTAEAKAKEIRDRYSRLIIGQVTTWKPLVNTNPGDTINITVDPKNIDDEFQIADITRKWGKGEVILTVVGNIGDDEELLVELTDRVDRIEAQRSERDVPEDRITDTEVRVTITPTVTLDSITASNDRFTNTARNVVRDGWRGVGNPTIAEIAVGDKNTDLSRTDTDLVRELDRASASETLVADTGVEYEASIGGSSVREIGLFTANNELIARGVFTDAAIESSYSGGLSTLTVQEGETYAVGSGTTETYFNTESAGTVQNAGTLQAGAEEAATSTVGLEVSNNADVPYGVVTNKGQKSIRDILADNSPTLTQFYGYGDDDTQPAETDTALGNLLDDENLDRILLQGADSDEQWEDVVSIGDADPLVITGGSLTTTQTCFTVEGEKSDSSSGDTSTASASDASDGSFAIFAATNYAERTYNFTPTTPIDPSDFAVYVRDAMTTNTGNSIAKYWISIEGPLVDAQIVSDFSVSRTEDQWAWNTHDDTSSGWNLSRTLEAGETYTIKIYREDPDGGDESLGVDVVAPADTRYNYTLDNTVDSNNALEGPEQYPDLIEVEFPEVPTRRKISEGELRSAWDDTSNKQFIAMKNSDAEGYLVSNNIQTTIETFASAETGIQAKIGISRYGSTTSTPSTGDSGQTVDFYDLFGDPDAITIADIGEAETRAPFDSLEGDVIQEAGQLTGSRDALTRSIFSQIPKTGTIDTETTIVSSEILGID